jgi:5-methylthioadenosine/S-adenosylhomocysteine deaminase
MNGSGDVLVRGGDILTADGSLEAGNILISAGRIVSVGNIPSPPPVEELDASGTIVVPGLVNAHMHSGENYNPGLYENLPLDLWFVHSHQVTRTRPLEAEAIYVRTMLGALQMLRSGTTCAVDFLYEAPEISLETLDPVVRAYRDLGMRATILLGVADKPFLASLPLDAAQRQAAKSEAPPPTIDGIMELAEAAVERWHEPGGLIGIGLGPSAPQRCSDELLGATLELAAARDLVWHTHVLETKTQAWTARQWHGRSFIEVLDDRGFLGPATALVHAVWLTDRDIEVIARTGTTMIHCLLSNLRLGDGVAPLPALHEAGATIALGTDGRGCDETLDMFELVKMTALIHKARGDDYERWPTAEQVFRMATVGASSCAGHGGRLGRIEPGACGDLTLVARKALPLTPLNDTVRQLVYGAASPYVRHVVVGGRIVVRDGQVVGVDVDALLDQAERYAKADRTGVPQAGVAELEALVRQVYERAEQSDVGLSAYVGSGGGNGGSRPDLSPLTAQREPE